MERLHVPSPRRDGGYRRWKRRLMHRCLDHRYLRWQARKTCQVQNQARAAIRPLNRLQRESYDFHLFSFCFGLTLWQGETADRWGVERKLMGLLPGRKTFVLNQHGVIVHAYQSAFNVKGHIGGALRAIKEMREAELSSSESSSMSEKTDRTCSVST